jgi:hypothetical protein
LRLNYRDYQDGENMSAGYSGTSLLNKLGIKSGQRIVILEMRRQVTHKRWLNCRIALSLK